MTENPKQLELFKPLLLFGVFILIVAIIGGLLALASKGRQDKIYQAYNQETKQYIQQNKAPLLTIFNELFPRAYCLNQIPQVACAFPNQEEIGRLLPPSLKDWSSTAFLKKDREKILMMRLSGDTREIYPYPQEKSLILNKLLSGEAPQIPWDEYTYELAGKEVVTPVMDSSGKVVGAIIRSVIEDKSF